MPRLSFSISINNSPKILLRFPRFISSIMKKYRYSYLSLLFYKNCRMLLFSIQNLWFEGSESHNKIFIRIALVKLNHHNTVNVFYSHYGICKSFSSKSLTNPCAPCRITFFFALRIPTNFEYSSSVINTSSRKSSSVYTG